MSQKKYLYSSQYNTSLVQDASNIVVVSQGNGPKRTICEVNQEELREVYRKAVGICTKVKFSSD